MDFISGLFGYVIPFIFVLSLVVFIHEMGHFLVARWFGVIVEQFSIGFGREIVGWTDKNNTRWKIGWLPLGGYVKFLGDENAASTPDKEALSSLPEEIRKDCFQFKPLHARAAVVAAGPVANFLLAIVIFAFMYSVIGQSVTAPRVDEVQPDGAAADAGFLPGDLVVSIDGSAIASFNDMQRIVSTSPERVLAFTVERDGSLVDLEVVPQLREITDRFGNTQSIGLIGLTRKNAEGDITTVRYNPAVAVWKGVEETGFIISTTMTYLGDIIVGRQDADQLGGPLRIAQVSGQVATLGLIALLNLAAILSVSIGLLNLFPVPMLDGGHLLYYAAEAVRGEPLGEKAQEYGFRIGLAAVMSLMLFATWNDLVHLRVFDYIGSVFS
ncbi:Membrane-associated zinc metalloprotease [Candidatus Phaeomarinobacter ectocarpi]|uniref:Zinc metalloprotease n=1 Tax=Candidatus Phaeomarinibacter ectocarpi TaxID=1458461 RepID=X5MEK1_9HYPH|nr:RIP metalloprotease RseP [Candidatus Phaeomarinobacter ectocarpi]CDO61002.1 Membrane-associated zinc metalloprotease [Candidatus Phaeomarinobacter ectocarpi]